MGEEGGNDDWSIQWEKKEMMSGRSNARRLQEQERAARDIREGS